MEDLVAPAEMVDIVPEVASADIHTDFEVVNTPEGSVAAGTLVDFEVVHTPADSEDGMVEDDTSTLVEVEEVEAVEAVDNCMWALRVFELVGSEVEVCFRS
jgi:hypothetical protein